VNVDRIKELRPLFHGSMRLVLVDGQTLASSRRYRGRVDAFAGLIGVEGATMAHPGKWRACVQRHTRVYALEFLHSVGSRSFIQPLI